jgi:hypothetical protein
MSVFDENIPPATPEHQLDRLVDGELSEVDRRSMLLKLEHEPEGWRRCALAFLEAQCWKAELGHIAAPATSERVQSTAVRPESGSQSEPGQRRQSWRQYLATTLTMAASFLLALVVGMGLRGNWSGGLPHSHDGSVVDVKEEFPLGSRDPMQPSTAAVIPASQALHQADNTAASGGWEMVTLAGDKSSDGRAETFRVPAQRRDALDPNMLEQMPDLVSPDMQQAFEQLGHRILQQREIVPVQMNDGRRLMVPVDHVEIHYVGRPSL